MKIHAPAAVLLLSLSACASIPIESKTRNHIDNASIGVFMIDGKLQLLSHSAPFGHLGRLDGVSPDAEVRKEAVTDPVFGQGQALRVTRDDGGVASIELYPDLPFVVIRQTVKNNTDGELDLRHAAPATFTVDFVGKKASDLATMGTAGLLPAHKNPGSYLFQTIADPETREGVVAGWLTHDRGDGVFLTSVNKRLSHVEIKAQIDYGHLRLKPGQSTQLETLLVGHFADARLGQEALADAIKKQYAIKLRPQRAGYCTWYSEVGGLTDPKNGAGALNEKDIVKLADFAKKELAPFGFNFIQIDDEWQDGATNPDGSRINGPRRGFTRHKPDGPYPSGMASTAKNLHDRNFEAGIWFLPFAANHQDKHFPKEWFMQRRDGMPYETVWGGTSLDTTNPDVQNYLRTLAKTIHGWGYTYFKMDGMWTGACGEQVYVNDGYMDDDLGNHKPFFKPDTTNIEALRLGLKTLREAAGNDVFFSGCNTSQNMRSLGGVIGLVDSMRIGPDNGFEWQDWKNETMHFEGGGIITGPIRANRLYFLHGKVWWNDPDPAYVRPAVKLEHAQLLASWVAISGGFNLNSDWLPGLPPERLDILKRCLPSHHEQARPVDYFENAMPGIWLVTSGPPTASFSGSLSPETSSATTVHPVSLTPKGWIPPVQRNVLGLYNWDSEAKTIGYDCAKSGLKADTTYHAFDFWAKQPAADFKGEFAFEMPKESCRILAVRAAEDHPVLVSTSRHVTQGIVDVSGESFKDGVLSATSAVVANDPYELRIAGLKDGKDWSCVKAEVSSEDAAAGVKIESVKFIETPKHEDGWVRFVITSPVSRPVKWSVKFQ